MGETKQHVEASLSHAKTYEEMADFWETHDTAEYAELFEEVTVEIHVPRHRRVPIEPLMFESLRLEAQSRGISTETLINLWLMERLRNVQKVTGPAIGDETKGAGEEEAAQVKG